MQKTATCKTCGEQFTYEAGARGRFRIRCSHCQIRPLPKTHYLCVDCGIEIYRKRAIGPAPRYCARCLRDHAHAEYENRIAKRVPFVIPSRRCERCDADFTPKVSGNAKYCPECKYPALLERSRRISAERTVKRKESIPTWQCERCGCAFQSWQSNHRYCAECSPIAKKEAQRRRTQSDRLKVNAEDGIANATGRDQRAQHALRRIHGHVPVALYEHINAKKVYERDGWICGICGEAIDRDVCFPAALSASVDHIIPLSRGGAHLYTNVQAAHLCCNISKGKKQVVTA